MPSNIEWTDETWNPVTGCSKVSPGCKHCYAETIAKRFWKGRKFTDVRVHEDRLWAPLHWKKPRMVFVNSMSDLFHEDVPDEFLHQVFSVMERCSQHTFQVLTKRAQRMAQYAGWRWGKREEGPGHRIPSRNIWLGVSCEDQQRADERIPWLVKTPAAVRFLSCEPLLGPIDLGLRNWAQLGRDDCRVDWVIVGGESGAGARPCDVADIRFIVEDCQAASVPCFVKQVGSKPYVGPSESEPEDYPSLHDRKGGDPAEWPEDLRVRQFPETSHAS